MMRASAVRRVGVGGGRLLARGVVLPLLRVGLPLLRGARGVLGGLVPRPSAPTFWLCVNLWILHAGRRAWRRARMLALTRMIKDLSKEDIQFMLGHLPIWIKDGDYESVRWLNSGLAEMWPQMNRMICSLLKNQLEPIINASLPANVSRINFKELDLGAMAPIITGVKPVTNQHLEFGLDIELKWGGCPRVVLLLEPSKGRSLPAELMGRIVENIMYVSIDSIITEGRLRLFFTPLVNDIVVGGLRMQLPERPMLDFNLSSYGMNIMSMPAVSQLLRRSIEETALGRMTWPEDIKFYWCSDENIAQSWSSTGSLPMGVLQIELLECHVVSRSGKSKLWSPYVVTTTSRKARKAQLSRSVTARKTSRFMMSQNQSVVVRPTDQAIRLVVLHDSGWSSLEYDLPLAILDIPMSQIMASAAPSSSGGSRTASAPPRAESGLYPQRESFDSSTAVELSNRSSLSAPAAPEDQQQQQPNKRWSMDDGDKHQQQLPHHAMSNPEQRTSAPPSSAPPSSSASPSSSARTSAFQLDRTSCDASGSGSHHPATTKAAVSRGPSTAHRPLHKDGDKASRAKGKHSKGFDWWDPLSWAGHRHSEAPSGDSSNRHAPSSSSVFENLFASGGHYSHSHNKGKHKPSPSKPHRSRFQRSSSTGSSAQHNRRNNKQIISPFLSDEDNSDEEHSGGVRGLEALFQPEGGWLPMSPLGSFTPLHIGAEVTLRTMQDYVSAVQDIATTVQDIATTGTATATASVMGGLKKVGDEVGNALNIKTKAEKTREDKAHLHHHHHGTPGRTRPPPLVHKPAVQGLKRSSSHPNVASPVQSLGLEHLPPGPLDDGALLRSGTTANDDDPSPLFRRLMEGSLASTREDGASSSSGLQAEQGPSTSTTAALPKPRCEWTVYRQSCLQHGNRVSDVNSLIHALVPARDWLRMPTATGTRHSRDSKEPPLAAHSGSRWVTEVDKDLSYTERPGVIKMRLTFYPTLLREPTTRDVVSPLGTLLVYVSQLRYQNLQLKEPLVMLRIDEQLLWIRAATAKNGLVSFDEEVAFPLERRHAEFKRLEVLVVEDQRTLHKLLHTSLQDAEVFCGVNIQLQNAIVRTTSKGSWPVYDLRSNRGGMAGLSDHGARVNCGDISLHMKWLLTAVV